MRMLSKDQLESRLRELPISPEDRARLRHAFREVEPEHGVRSGAFNGSEEFLSRAAPEHLEPYERFRTAMPSHGLFSYVPLPQVFLRMAYLASAAFPGMSVREACDAMSRSAVDITRKHVVMRPVFRACEGDLGRFLDFIGSSISMLTNFGEVYVDRVAPTHYRLRHEKWYDFYSDYLGSIGYVEGLFEAFDITDGHVSIDIVDSRTFDLVVIW